MSRKKQTPGLMGSPEYWPDTPLEWVEVGARSILRSAGDDPAELRNTSGMWSLTGGSAFGDLDLARLLDDLQKAGFPEYPSAVAVAERNRIATRFTGAAPSIDDPKDLRASHAWVLAQLSALEYARQRHLSENDLHGVWVTGLRVGRLVEWWVWRRDGHDRRAVSRRKSDRGWKSARAGGSVENEERADMRRRWVKWALGRAEALRREKPSRTKGRLAEIIHDEAATREARIAAVDGDCGHDPAKPKRHCFVCSQPSRKTIENSI